MAMNKERFYTELTRKFEEEGIQVACQSDSCLQVLLDGEPVGRIDRFGYSFRSTGDLDSEQANQLCAGVFGISFGIRCANARNGDVNNDMITSTRSK